MVSQSGEIPDVVFQAVAGRDCISRSVSQQSRSVEAVCTAKLSSSKIPWEGWLGSTGSEAKLWSLSPKTVGFPGARWVRPRLRNTCIPELGNTEPQRL